MTRFAKIFLVRHGEVVNHKNIIYGYLPVPLSPKGRAQARKAGLFLKKQKIGAIFASPMRRTQETAKIITKVIGGKVKIITDKNLRESGLGHYTEGATREDFKNKYKKLCYLYNRFPAKVNAGGENLAKMANRILKSAGSGIKKYPGKNLVFVSHRDPILAALLKISKRNFNDLHKVQAICDKGSICEVLSVGKRFINKTYLAP